MPPTPSLPSILYRPAITCPLAIALSADVGAAAAAAVLLETARGAGT
jgi:hypothetical protein